MADDLTGQVSSTAAEVYEDFFVPALFLQWTPRVADVAQLAPGQKVLGVACGTGVLPREAERRAVARRKAPGIDRRSGMAESHPFAGGVFDAVVSQFRLMFFENRVVAQREVPSIESWMHTDVKGWTLADMIDDARYSELLRAAKTLWAAFVQHDGTVAFPSPAHIAIATRRKP